MAYDFPDAPTLNQVFGNYTWDGEKWKVTPVTGGGGGSGGAAPSLPNGRLTSQSGSPVLTSNFMGATSMYWTPYNGSVVPLYDGTTWVATVVNEISSLLSDTTKNPAAIGSNKVNDWFVWNDAGTIRLCHGPDWTNDTTRAMAVNVLNGVRVNGAAITNGPAINRGTYVGTTRSNGSSTIDWHAGGATTGGMPAFLNIWNMYNRVDVLAKVTDTTASWTYLLATPRPLNNSTNNRINFVSGLNQEPISVTHRILAKNDGTAASVAAAGLAMDTTSAFDFFAWGGSATDAIAINLNLSITTPYAPQLGYHYFQALEQSQTDVPNTFYGTAPMQGLHAMFRM